ncbi:CDP-alcohol phosphatidyltransferase family protein [bacterium]|nr:CDP-alcohol phosphatidyltransferase family protein [bacterium]
MTKLSEINPIPRKVENFFLSAIGPIVNLASKLNVHPNTFTTLSFLMGAVASYFVIIGNLRIASLFLLFSGLCDVLDGRLARQSNKVTKFGALYDSTLDRYSEVVFFFGLAYFFISHDWFLTTVAVAIGLGGSLMVSYVRARAEGLGFECKVGILQRPERLLLLGIGGLIHLYTLVAAIWIVAVLSNVTAIQRIVHVWDQDKKEKSQNSV